MKPWRSKRYRWVGVIFNELKGRERAVVDVVRDKRRKGSAFLIMNFAESSVARTINAKFSSM